MIGFFDRIEILSGSLSNAIEDYFYLDGVSEQFGSKRFVCLSGETKVCVDTSRTGKRSKLNVLKIASYCTVIFPLLFICAKAIYRLKNNFTVVEALKPIYGPYRVRKEDEHHVKRIRLMRDDKNYIPDKNNLIFDVLGQKLPANRILKDICAKKEGFLKICRREPFINFDLAKFLEEQQLSCLGKIRKRLFILKNCLKGLFKQKNDSTNKSTVLEKVKHDEYIERVRREEQNEREILFARNICVTAQGVESGKGGIANLLNIMLEGLTVSPWYGPLIGNDPGWAAGPHGPYYIIVDVVNPCHDSAKNRFENRMLEESMHAAYLVPTQEHRQILIDSIEESIKKGFISPLQGQSAMNRIVTYKEFNELPDAIVNDPRKLRLAVERRAIIRQNEKE